MKNLKKVLALVLSVAMVLGTMTMAFGQVIVPESAFTDVTPASEYETAAAKLKAVGVVDGYKQADGTFKLELEKNLTRAEVAKTIVALLGLAEGVEVNGPNTTTFADVNGHWAASWISIATGQGIIQGHADGKFHPDADVTEEQAIAMIVRALEWGPIVAGNYPYGENAKAMELKLVKTSPVYGRAATRGYVFAAAADALTAPMAERKATQGSVSYEGEGNRTLLVDRLGFNVAPQVIVDKTARMERELDKNEFQSGRTTFVYKSENFDATEILGEVVNVWYDVNERTKDNEVIFVEIDPVDSTKITGVVEESKKNEIKLENGRTYKLEDATVYVDNKVNGTIPTGAYVTITLDKKNDAVFVDAFDLTISQVATTNALNVVTAVEKAEANRLEYRNQDSHKLVVADEKLIVYKDGKIVTTDAIEKYDLVKAITLPNQAKTTFVFVIGETTATDKLVKVEVDGTKGTENRKVYAVLENEERIEVDKAEFLVVNSQYKGSSLKDKEDDVVAALKDAQGKNVTFIVLPTGKAKAMVTDVDPRGVKTALAYEAGIKYDTFGATSIAAIRFLNEKNEKEEREFKTLNSIATIAIFKAINSTHLTGPNKNDYLGRDNETSFKNVKNVTDQFTLYVDGTPKLNKTELEVDGKIAKTFTLKKGEDVKYFKNYILETEDATKTAKSYDITDSTVFYVLNKGQNDYSVKKYDAIKDAKIIGDMKVEVVEYTPYKGESYSTPTADVVVVTQGYFEDETTLEYGIITWARRTNDAIYYTIFNGSEEVDYATDKGAKLLRAGTAVKFELTGKKLQELPEIKKDSVETDELEANLSRVRGNLYTIDDKNYELAPGFVSMNEDIYDSSRGNVVSYVLEKGKLKALNFVRKGQTADRTAGKKFVGERVLAVDTARNTVTIRTTDGERITYAVFGNDAKAFMPLVEKADQIGFELDSYGDITKFTGIQLYSDVDLAGTDLVINRHDDFQLFGSDKKITGNILVFSNDVYMQDVTVSGGTVTLDSSVTHFEAKDTNFDNLTLDGGGTNSVILTDVKVTGNLKVNAKVRVVIKGASTVENVEVTAKATDAKIEIEKDAKVTDLTADAVIEVTGADKITEATITVEGVKLDKTPKTLIAEDVTVVIGGTEKSEADLATEKIIADAEKAITALETAVKDLEAKKALADAAYDAAKATVVAKKSAANNAIEAIEAIEDEETQETQEKLEKKVTDLMKRVDTVVIYRTGASATTSSVTDAVYTEGTVTVTFVVKSETEAPVSDVTSEDVTVKLAAKDVVITSFSKANDGKYTVTFDNVGDVIKKEVTVIVESFGKAITLGKTTVTEKK